MRYAVRITTQDDDRRDLKVFDELARAERRFNYARMLMHQVPGESIDARVLHRLENLLTVDSIERVELHECSTGENRDAAKQVEAGQSKLLKWIDIDHPWADIIEELKREGV